MGPEELRRRRSAAHWLSQRPAAPPTEVVARLVGVQAQDPPAARLAVRARSAAATADTVRAAAERGEVVSSWLMRGTLHLVAAEELRWLLRLFGARNAKAGARRRRELGLDDDTCARALRAIERALGGGPLSRADLVARVIEAGVAVDPQGQAPAHLMAYAASQGLICRGPELAGGEPGYVLLDSQVPRGRDYDDEAGLAELTRRYLTGYGPASPADFAAWSGLPLGAARRGFAAADPVEVGAELWAAADAPAPASGPVLRLLGSFDAYLLGYRGRDLALDPRHAKRIQAGGGLIHPAVLVDGQVIGAWRLRRTPCRGVLEVAPFEPLGTALEPQLEAEAADIGRFLGVEVTRAG